VHVAGEAETGDDDLSVQRASVDGHGVPLERHPVQVLAGADPQEVPGHAVPQTHVHAVQGAKDPPVDGCTGNRRVLING